MIQEDSGWLRVQQRISWNIDVLWFRILSNNVPLCEFFYSFILTNSLWITLVLFHFQRGIYQFSQQYPTIYLCQKLLCYKQSSKWQRINIDQFSIYIYVKILNTLHCGYIISCVCKTAIKTGVYYISIIAECWPYYEFKNIWYW